MRGFFLICWMVLVSVPSCAQSTAAPASQDKTDDAAAKVAARKKKFEEAKARLEGQEHTQQTQPAPCSDGKPVLYITPNEASMLVGESRGFTLFDTEGHKLTAAADWSVSSSSLATLTPGKEPMVTANAEGTFTVTARIDSRSAEATVKVYPGNSLPIGTIRWKVDPIPCSKNGAVTKIVQAAPH